MMLTRDSNKKTCVVLQPSYIPWRGYFHQVYLADAFVFYDDVQYDKNGWRNRNMLKGANGLHWLSVPVSLPTGSLATEIRHVNIDHRQPWASKHWKSIVADYGRTRWFGMLESVMRPRIESNPERLADLTIPLVMDIAAALGIRHTQFMRSSEMGIGGGRTERLAAICRSVGADRYVSGPSARSYLDEACMRDAGIEVAWMEYEYPEYPQVHGAFAGNVSVIDLIANAGSESGAYIWGGAP
ncbi:MAG: WbqC family protein [Planctomycetes bacterium]|nr:WbqC family protein [Planctomycetota bacterium]